MMEDSVRTETPKEVSLWKRLAIWFIAALTLGVLIYLTAVFTRYALEPSPFPLWTRLPLFIGPAIMALLSVWFVYKFVQLRTKDAAKRAGREYKLSPRAALWANADEWAIPILMSFFAFGISYAFFALAFEVRMRPDLVWLRNLLIISGVCFLPLSMIWPIRAIRRKRKSGSFIPTQKDIDAREPKQLWKRKMAAGLWSFVAVWVTIVATLKNHDRVFAWVLAVFFWALAAWSIWEIRHPLVRRKTSDASTNESTES
jgi:hypothetical protein